MVQQKIYIWFLLSVSLCATAKAGTEDDLLRFFPLSADIGGSLVEVIESIRSSSSEICRYIKCHEPTLKEDCPEGTIYEEGIAQFGCCGACVRYRAENERCSGSVDPQYGSGYKSHRSPMTQAIYEADESEKNVVHSLWCDYQLYCNDQMVCEQDDKNPSCRAIQSAYDSDIANNVYMHFRDEYRWRPDCDEKGYYKPKQCKGSIEEEQTCVCVDKSGETIKGKAFPWQTELYEKMNCLCSLLYAEQYEAGIKTGTLHCQENGNFEALQCDMDWCTCVNETDGKPISEVLPQSSIRLLPCYNATTHGSIYLRQCDSEYHARQVLNEALRGHGVNQVPTSLLTCDPDGAYGERQCDGSDCSCVDKYNAYLAAPSPSDTNCNCARDQNTYEQAGQEYNFKCDTSHYPGQYSPQQQTGSLVYCVDLDGIRISSKVREQCLEELNCEAAKLCQEGKGSCDKVCPNCPSSAFYFSDDYEESDECEQN